MLYMVTFTINIPPMLAYIPYMDPMGYKYILPSHTVQNAKPAMSEARELATHLEKAMAMV